MTGSLTSCRLGGRADTTAWLGRGPYRVGARLRVLAGAMMFMGKAKLSSLRRRMPGRLTASCPGIGDRAVRFIALAGGFVQLD
jgi:hypothetical protein